MLGISKDAMFLSSFLDVSATGIKISRYNLCRCTESVDDLQMLYEMKQRIVLKNKTTCENFRQQLQVNCYDLSASA